MSDEMTSAWFLAAFAGTWLAARSMRSRTWLRITVAFLGGLAVSAFAEAVANSWRGALQYGLDRLAWITVNLVISGAIVLLMTAIAVAARASWQEWRAARAQPPLPEEEPLLDIGPKDVARDIAAAVREVRTQSGIFTDTVPTDIHTKENDQ